MARRQAPVAPTKVPLALADRRLRLESLRDALTVAVTDASRRDLPPLAGQLRAVLADLAALPDMSGVSDVDDLAAKRARRRATATGS